MPDTENHPNTPDTEDILQAYLTLKTFSEHAWHWQYPPVSSDVPLVAQRFLHLNSTPEDPERKFSFHANTDTDTLLASHYTAVL